MSPRKKRLATLAILGLALVLGAGFYIGYFLSRPTGSGEAGPIVDRAAFQQTWTKRRVQLIGIGDSVTAGFGAISPSHSYFNRLQTNPKDEYASLDGLCLSRVLPNLQSENLAVSGSTSQDHLSAINNRLKTYDADVFGLVVMTTGGNDLIHSYGTAPPRECALYGATLAQAQPWIESFQLRLDTMLETITARFPGGCEIYLGDIYDPTDGVGDTPSVSLPPWPDGLAIHAQYNAVLATAAQSHPHVFLVPLRETFLGHGAHCRQFWRATYVREDPYYWFYDNIEDPNDRGHDALRRVFLNAILEHSALVRKQTDDPHP